MLGMRRLFAACAFVTVVVAGVAASTPFKPTSPLALWFQNNLDWTEDVNHPSFLFLDSQLSHADAAQACARLGEQLVSAAAARTDENDLRFLLQYAILRGDLTLGQPVWLADASAQLWLTRVNITSNLGGGPRPALCTQSAQGTTRNTSVATSSNRINATSTATGNIFHGFRDLKSFRFLGIPYANPPARFAYSSVSSTRNAIVDASKFGLTCYQGGPGPFSEDCLSLNIFTPYLPGTVTTVKSKLRPVLFWIHGGAFTGGTGSDETFDGGNFASRGDIVVVTINYRLSSLGFLAIPGTNIKGNYGLADQITALQWVQQNIQAFGGDPSKVTIAGQSAGAGSVRALLASPRARGLFAAAIPGSNLAGYGYATTYSDYYTPEQSFSAAGQSILTSANCTDVKTASLCLSKVPAANLVSGNVARYIVVDGSYITTSRLDVRIPGKSARVPLLIGTTADDGAAFLSFSPSNTNRSVAISNALPDRPDLAAAVDSSTLFPTPSSGNATLDAFNLTARITTDVQFRCLDQATVHTAVRNDVWPTAWYYQFDRAYQTPNWNPNAPVCQPPPTTKYPLGDPSQPYMKCHSGDLYFEFGTFGQFGLPFRDEHDLPFTQLVLDSFSSFTRTHDPNPSASFLSARGYTNTSKIVATTGKWAPVTKSKDTLRLLNWPPQQSGFLELEQCKLLGLPVTYYDRAT